MPMETDVVVEFFSVTDFDVLLPVFTLPKLTLPGVALNMPFEVAPELVLLPPLVAPAQP